MGLSTLRFIASLRSQHRKLAIQISHLSNVTNQGKRIMKTTPFTSMLSSTERTLTAAIAVTLSLVTTTVIAAAFQGAAIVGSPTLIAMLSKAFG